MTSQTIIKKLQSHGYRAQFISSTHTDDLKKEIDGFYDDGQISDYIYQNYLNFDYAHKKIDFEPKSILIVAEKSSITIVNFSYNGKKYPIVIPPTYIASKNMNTPTKIISDIISSLDYNFDNCRLPLKLLAVRSNLAQYGKNNIAYIPQMGSFFRLIGFFTDITIENDIWDESNIMDACINCTMCTQKCPTGCIDENKDIIDASKCLSFYNERDDDFPEWINPKWHNSLIGCCIIV